MAVEGTLSINGRALPYPEKFTMQRVPFIAAEYTTMMGHSKADIVGWKFADTTITWSALYSADLDKLIEAIGDVRTSFNIEFIDESTGTRRTEEAILRGFSKSKVRYQNDGKIMWEDISINLSFPNCH